MTIINKKYDSNNGEPSSNLNQNKDTFEEKIWNALRVSNKLDAGHNTEVNRLGRKVSDTQKLLVEMHNNIVDSTHQEITKAADVFVGETDRQFKEAMGTLMKYWVEMEKPLQSVGDLYKLVQEIQEDMKETKKDVKEAKEVIKNRLTYGQTLDEVVEKELLKNRWNDEDQCIDEDRQKLGEK